MCVCFFLNAPRITAPHLAELVLIFVFFCFVVNFKISLYTCIHDDGRMGREERGKEQDFEYFFCHPHPSLRVEIKSTTNERFYFLVNGFVKSCVTFLISLQSVWFVLTPARVCVCV